VRVETGRAVEVFGGIHEVHHHRVGALRKVAQNIHHVLRACKAKARGTDGHTSVVTSGGLAREKKTKCALANNRRLSVAGK
jgi:hypothetical protein